MHRNTWILVTLLAVFAALVVGVNIGKKFSGNQQAASTQQPTSTPATNQPNLIEFTNTYCGFAVQYPETFTKLENATGSAVLTNSQSKTDSIIMTCQKDIPRSALPPEYIETLTYSDADGATSVSANLYHDSSPKDGAKMDIVIFTHPKNKMDIFIAGYGETFNQIIKTITLLP